MRVTSPTRNRLFLQPNRWQTVISLRDFVQLSPNLLDQPMVFAILCLSSVAIPPQKALFAGLRAWPGGLGVGLASWGQGEGWVRGGACGLRAGPAEGGAGARWGLGRRAGARSLCSLTCAVHCQVGAPEARVFFTFSLFLK